MAGAGVAGLAACGSVRQTEVNLDAGADTSPALDGAGSDTPPAQEFVSCMTLPMTCGSANNESCCASGVVPGGTFDRSFDVANDTLSGNMNFPATLSTFKLDKYEVTVGRFRAFVNAGMGTQDHPPADKAGVHAAIPGSGWDPNWNASLLTSTAGLIAAVKCDPALQTWTDAAAGNEDRPMNCISWYEAMAFCIWDGGYLPTEAEWNYAAAGGNQQRAYPWSSPPNATTIDPDHASYNDGTSCVGDGQPGCAVTDLVPVGTKFLGGGRWGQVDLAGNVQEWALDWAAQYSTTCTDCANLTPGAKREARGGSFDDDDDAGRTGARLNFAPTDRNNLVGARCARAP